MRAFPETQAYFGPSDLPLKLGTRNATCAAGFDAPLRHRGPQIRSPDGAVRAQAAFAGPMAAVVRPPFVGMTGTEPAVAAPAGRGGRRHWSIRIRGSRCDRSRLVADAGTASSEIDGFERSSHPWHGRDRRRTGLYRFEQRPEARLRAGWLSALIGHHQGRLQRRRPDRTARSGA
jgi:hypothetical protein